MDQTTIEVNPAMKFALALADQDFLIIPLQQNSKVPLILDWRNAASRDKDQIAEWFKTWPRMNYGYVPDGNYIVVDTDQKNGKDGENQLAVLELQYGLLPKTLTIKTASGGKHRLFKVSRLVRSSTSKVADGIDIVGTTQCVGPGSVIDGKAYEIIEDVDDIPEAPQWLINLAGEDDRKPSPAQGDPVLERVVEEVAAHLDPNAAYCDWRDNVCALGAANIVGDDANRSKARAIAHRYSSGHYKPLTRLTYTPGPTDLVIETMPPKDGGIGFGSVVIKARADGFTGNVHSDGRTASETFKDADLKSTSADAAEDQPDPLNMFADFDHLKGVSLTRDMLPDVVWFFSTDAAERIGVEVSMVAIPALAVGAAALHDNYKIQPRQHDTTWLERGCIWAVVIADPGGRKTPALDVATKPLEQIESRMIAEDHKAKEKYDEANKAYKAKDKDAADLDILLGDCGRPQPPRKRRLVSKDATMDSLGPILAENDRGLLSKQDEISGWIYSFDAFRNSKGRDKATALALWNGGPHSIDRKTDGASFYIPNWSSSVIGGIQPDKLRDMLTKDKLQDDGFLQRLQPFFGETLHMGQDREPDHAAVARYEKAIQALIELPTPQPYGRTILAPDARKYWDDVEQIAFTISKDNSFVPHMRSHAAKWPSMFARLLLTFHAFECVSKGRSITAMVEEATAAKAHRLMMQFFKPHALQFYDRMFRPAYEAEQHCRWIAGHLLVHKMEKITASYIRGRYRQLADDNAVVRTMEDLQRVGWVGKLIIAPGGHGIPSYQWTVNPRVHDGRFATIAESERQRRLDAQPGKSKSTGE